MLLGIDLSDGAVLAVLSAANGDVVERRTAGGALEAALRQVTEGLAAGPVVRAGVALRDPHDRAVADLLASVSADRGLAAPRLVGRGAGLALGEQWRGSAHGARHVVALHVDETVHAGVIVDDQLVEGAHGRAGAAGWMALNPVERGDYRKHGCLEAEVGTAGIVRRLVWRVKAGDPSRAVDLAGGDLAAIDVGHVLDAARGHDAVAISVVRDTARYLGMAIANLVAVLDPEVVVLGGLVAAAGDLLLDQARSEAAKRLSGTHQPPRVAAATLGDVGPALGAARAASMDE